MLKKIMDRFVVEISTYTCVKSIHIRIIGKSLYNTLQQTIMIELYLPYQPFCAKAPTRYGDTISGGGFPTNGCE